MQKLIYFSSILAFVLLITNCQYPVKNSVLPDPQQFIIINADITEAYGKLSADYTLSEVTSLGGYSFTKKPVISNAYITDGQGVRYDFQADGFLPSTFQGKVGESYKLNLEADGNRYESSVEMMTSSAAIDSFGYVFTEETFRAPTDVRYKGFDVYAYFKDDANAENYYQWDWVHYERATSCEKKYSNQERQVVLYPCTPYDCWNIKYNDKVIVQSDRLREGQPIAHKLLRVPFTTPPNKYYLRLEQRSISKRVYDYYQSLEVQSQNSGTLYDIPAQTKFSPNITNINDPNEKVIGVFNVYSSQFRVIYVDRGQKINGEYARVVADLTPFTADPLAQSPCVEGLFRTLSRPFGWED
jgi:hypothetical protein